ncbi:uncharacterized protein N7498_006590 [Penicillium cinerascens]|uniref:N-acetyltransferase domain-containing protein n=1 Tax=Penicillium cinerascens TaxID=70096 RepID=A0A9W9MII3_9EURO|nr:uncharacterized protein N7498_006590 [Penicillium cinerascens]KAJ5201927.1 hypothetical protein N7498_006590 [Penicillium cinerascens]
MSIPKVTVSLSPVHTNPSIVAVVRTVNLAFSSDPLIQWLRPNATPWSEHDPSAWKWQYRRVQTIMSRGQVLQSESVGQMAQVFQKKSSTSKDKAAPEKGSRIPVSQDLDITSSDAGAVRVNKLIAANKASADGLQKQYSKRELWYLEVIAVHPALQSRGLGGGVMRWILEHVGNQPIYLECTRRDNVSFYEAFGFQIVEEVELVDDDDGEKLAYWVMVRSQDP